jgi:dienelactone hydrolase
MHSLAVLLCAAIATLGAGNIHEEGRLPSGAAWTIDIPAEWNGTLLLYSHGYGGGPSYPVRNAPGGTAGKELLARGYALAASSYSQDGWAVESALVDQIALIDLFAQRRGKPKRTIAWGESMGGLVTEGLAQTQANKLDGAVCLCGSVGGVVGMLNLSLDGAFAIKTLLAPNSGMQLVNLSDERANNALVRKIVDGAQATPAGRARLALAAALGQVALWGRVGPEPKPDDFAAQQANQYRAIMTALFAPRQPLEQRAGGNFSWNTGIDYRRQVDRSGRRPALIALYREAGLDLDKDIEALNRAPRVEADPKATAYMKRNIIPSGEIGVPVLTISSPGDEMTFFAHEQALASAVREAGRSALLRQAFVNRAGHCVYGTSELLAAIQTVEQRARTGAWQDTSAWALNQRASAVGPDTPQFTDAVPPEFLRPCTLRQPACEGEPVSPAGTGSDKAISEGDAGVPGHTIYRPADLNRFGPDRPMPVVAWANGGCANSSRGFENFLLEIASHGFLVAAIGPPGVTGAAATGNQTRSAQLLEALDWATAENRRPDSKYYRKLDPAKFAVMGQSCGGLQALEVSPDPRVTTSVIMNSGVLNTTAGAPPMPVNIGKDILKRLHAPVVYIIGGQKDIAFPNASDDFARIDNVPVAMANLDVGHGGTYREPNGGEFGRVAVAWLKWRLQGDETAGKMWTGPSCGLCADAKWTLEKKRLP